MEGEEEKKENKRKRRRLFDSVSPDEKLTFCIRSLSQGEFERVHANYDSQNSITFIFFKEQMLVFGSLKVKYARSYILITGNILWDESNISF